MPDWWEWKHSRARIARFLRDAKTTDDLSQTLVGERGGVTQTDISKMIRNYRKGPYVETFLRTLHGLNVKPSEFFAELERGAATPPGAVALRAPLPAMTDDGETQLALAIGRQFLRLLRMVPPTGK